jgi:hypothetical protein
MADVPQGFRVCFVDINLSDGDDRKIWFAYCHFVPRIGDQIETPFGSRNKRVQEVTTRFTQEGREFAQFIQVNIAYGNPLDPD